MIVRDPARAPQPPGAEVAAAAYEDSEAIDKSHPPRDYHPETLEEARESRAVHPDWLINGWIGSSLMLDT